MTSNANQGATEAAPRAMAGVRVAGLVKLVAALLLLNVSLTDDRRH